MQPQMPFWAIWASKQGGAIFTVTELLPLQAPRRSVAVARVLQSRESSRQKFGKSSGFSDRVAVIRPRARLYYCPASREAQTQKERYGDAGVSRHGHDSRSYRGAHRQHRRLAGDTYSTPHHVPVCLLVLQSLAHPKFEYFIFFLFAKKPGALTGGPCGPSGPSPPGAPFGPGAPAPASLPKCRRY